MSFSDVAPIRPAGSLLRVMREDCRRGRQATNIVLDAESSDRFLLDVLPVAPSDVELGSWLASGFRLPLAYPSVHAELNVISNLCMLNSLSGYRRAFHQALGQGAHKTIVQIIIGLYISDPAGDSRSPLSAETLAALHPTLILERLNLPTHDEKPHAQLPATIVGTPRRDELYEALETLCVGANDTGKRLMQMKCPDLGVFVAKTLQQAHAEGKTDEERAAIFATTLIEALPIFNDAYTLKQPEHVTLHVHKRALLLLSWLHAAFKGRPSGDVPPIPDPAVLPAFVDNVIPSLLVHFGVLDLRQASLPGLRKWSEQLRSASEAKQGDENQVIDGPTLTREEAYVVRAAAVDACYSLKERGRVLATTHNRPWLSTLTEALIDGFLWTQAKRPDLTIVPRLVEKKTFMY